MACERVKPTTAAATTSNSATTTTTTTVLWPISGHIFPTAGVSKQLILYWVRMSTTSNPLTWKANVYAFARLLSRILSDTAGPASRLAVAGARSISQSAKHAFDKVEIPSRQHRRVGTEEKTFRYREPIVDRAVRSRSLS